MKNNLGKILIFFIFTSINIHANEYMWSASINKEQVLVNEAVHLHYSCKFNSRDELHVIEFNPVGKYKDYDVYLLSERESIIDGKRVNDFEFVAFLKSSGHVEFNFDVMMKKTNQDSINNTVLGRDNADYEQFSKKLIKQKKLSVDVLANDIDLVGSFELSVKKDKPSIQAYEPYHVEIVVEGIGNLDKLKAIDINITDTKVFASKVKRDYVLSEDGYKGTWSQKFAIVSAKNFDFPNIYYKYLDSKSNTEKKLEHKSFSVDVKELYKKEDLLDKEEKSIDVFKLEYLYYFLIFLSGYLAGKIKIKNNRQKNIDEVFLKKVESCKSLDELLILLIINNDAKYVTIIDKIEAGELSLPQAKNYVKVTY